MIIVSLLMVMLIILNCCRTSFINALIHSASRVLTIVNFSERNNKSENGLSIKNLGKSI